MTFTLNTLYQQQRQQLTLVSPERLAQYGHVPVTGITSDSRQVKPGFVFVALKGSHTDGQHYVAQALAQGAIAVVSSEFIAEQTVWFQTESPQATWTALAAISADFYGHPSAGMTLVGITGTNGKTSVSHFVEAILRHAGQSVGLIGTLGVLTTATAETYQTTGHTTPMAPELQKILADFRAQKTQSVVMEVSSHALDQDRTVGCQFQVAVFTNLTQDHLDYHQTMAQYGLAKQKLFSGLQPGAWGVINRDDPAAPDFLAACPEGVQTYTYGLENAQAQFRAVDIEYALGGVAFRLIDPEGGSHRVALQLSGQFSVYNALAALATGVALGVPLATCLEALSALTGVRGRFEVVSTTPCVIIDYAHTPDGLENILKAARAIVPLGSHLWVVFGCGGDRDTTKRPKMGRLAEQWADYVVVTSDNPRSEAPQQILTDILSGIERFEGTRMHVEADRELAIAYALRHAKPQDVVVIAGKGHEDYQILADRTIHFDDREVALSVLACKQSL